MTWEDKSISAETVLIKKLKELLHKGHGEIVIKVSKASNKIVIRKSEDDQIED